MPRDPVRRLGGRDHQERLDARQRGAHLLAGTEVRSDRDLRVRERGGASGVADDEPLPDASRGEPSSHPATELAGRPGDGNGHPYTSRSTRPTSPRARGERIVNSSGRLSRSVLGILKSSSEPWVVLSAAGVFSNG